MSDAPVTPQPGPRLQLRGPQAVIAVAVVALIGAGIGTVIALRSGNPGTSGGYPAARVAAVMAYDQERKQSVMFGGQAADGSALRDTWLWDGSNWTEAHPSNSPSARGGEVMGWDPVSHRVILVGGMARAQAQAQCTSSPNSLACSAQMAPQSLTDVWAWDGSNWTQLQTNTDLQGHLRGFNTLQMATDDSTGKLVLITSSFETPIPPVMSASATPVVCPAVTCAGSSGSGSASGSAETSAAAQGTTVTITPCAGSSAACAPPSQTLSPNSAPCIATGGANASIDLYPNPCNGAISTWIFDGNAFNRMQAGPHDSALGMNGRLLYSSRLHHLIWMPPAIYPMGIACPVNGCNYNVPSISYQWSGAIWSPLPNPVPMAKELMNVAAFIPTDGGVLALDYQGNTLVSTDGYELTQQQVPGPPLRYSTAGAPDRNGHVVLFGGAPQSIRVCPIAISGGVVTAVPGNAGGSQPNAAGVMATAPPQCAPGTAALDDTWIWDGSRWSQAGGAKATPVMQTQTATPTSVPGSCPPLPVEPAGTPQTAPQNENPASSAVPAATGTPSKSTPIPVDSPVPGTAPNGYACPLN